MLINSKSNINPALNLYQSNNEVPLGTTYYPNGLIKSVKFLCGSWFKYEYDLKDRISRITDDDNQESYFEFNADGYETFYSRKSSGNIYRWQQRKYDEHNQVIRYVDSEGNFWNTGMRPKIIHDFDVRNVAPATPCPRNNFVLANMQVKAETNSYTDYSPVSQRTKNVTALNQAEEKIKIILMNLEADTGLSVNFIDVKSQQQFGKPTEVANVSIQLELKP